MSGRRRGGEGEAEAENSERWLLTYSDMITLLLALFVVLFAMSSINLKKFVEFKTGLIKSFNNNSINSILHGGTGLLQHTSLVSHPGSTLGPVVPSIVISAGNPIVKPPLTESQLAQQVQQAVNSLNLQNQVQVITAQQGVVVRILTDHAFFATDSADLGASGDQIVDLIGKIVYPLPNQIEVNGYTDNQPIVGGPYTSNFELSAIRAVNVLLRLVHVDGVNPARIAATGYGSSRPVVPNDSPANQAMNRRVDVVILNSTTPSTSLG
ncbi:MAG: flagellar motor protein MotB [Acidimicrobiales bacterium]